MRTISISFWLCVTAACAQDLSFVRPMGAIRGLAAPCAASAASPACAALVRQPVREAPSRALWLSSVTALSVANALDMHSSWGKHELNQTLAGTSGNFGRQGALLKLAFQGGLMGFECLLMHHRPSAKLNKVLSIVNFGAAGLIGGVAAHNYTVAKP